MMLKPVIKSADPYFNHEAAQRAADWVMSLDEDVARSFTTMIVAETLWDDIAKNHRTLQRHLDDVVTKRVERVEKALDRMVSKKAGATEFTETFTEIAKAVRTPYDYGYVFEESRVKRDQSGRFQTKVNITAKKPIKDKIARATPNLPNPDKKSYKRLTPKQQAEYQQGYQQVATFLDTVRDSGMAGDSKIYATIRERGPSGRTYVTEVSGTKVPDIDPETEVFAGVEARPTSLSVGGASFGLVSALGGSTHAAGQAGATMDAADSGMRSFADDWTSAGTRNQASSNDRLYGRVEAGSRFLGQVAPAGSKLQIAGAFGEFVGRQGPQAERVLGPRARTTMYRYRGTEKTPDKELTGEYNKLSRGYDIDRIGPEDKKKLQGLQNSALVTAERRKGSKLTDAEKKNLSDRVARNALGQSPTAAAGQAEAGSVRARQAAEKFMMEKVPKGNLYDLQLKSGHTPPSEGVIIDKEGKIVTQAIGYGDDHYLPFNLKNLKGLRGGEYIRTRSVGGPTTEDIYTGLITGAKRVTVVSRSGTFTVEFDDTFRGTRRYNDKAGRMVDRYGKILDAVKSEQVERQPLDPAVRQEIAESVENEFGDWTPAREKRKIIAQREAEFKENPTLTRMDEERIEARISQIGGSDAERNRVRAQLRNEVLESKAFNFRLNGDGYAAAVTALQEQFPYYIKQATHRPTREGRYEGATDRGYVKPNYNRPQGALEGYYDASVNGEGTFTDASGQRTGKNTADRVDFQNSRGRLNRVADAPAREAEPEPVRVAGGQLTPTQAAATPAEVAADQIERASDVRTLSTSAATLQQSLATKISPDQRGPMADVLGMDEAQFSAWYASPANQKKFKDQVDTVVKPVMDKAGVKDQVTAFEAAHGLVGGEKFDRTRHMNTVPTQPYSFEGAPYLRGGKLAKKQAELQRISARTNVPGFGALSEMTHDADFKEALGTAQQLRVVADQIKQAPPENRGSYLQAIAQNDTMVSNMSDDQKRLLTNPERVDQMIEDINRAWALRQLINRQGHKPAAHMERVNDELQRGSLQPVEGSLPPTRPTAERRAEAPDAKYTRRSMTDYREALSTYAMAIGDGDPGMAEAVEDIAGRFDIAAYSGKEEDAKDAYEQLNSLNEDRPEHKRSIEQAIMNQMRKRYS